MTRLDTLLNLPGAVGGKGGSPSAFSLVCSVSDDASGLRYSSLPNVFLLIRPVRSPNGSSVIFEENAEVSLPGEHFLDTDFQGT